MTSDPAPETPPESKSDVSRGAHLINRPSDPQSVVNTDRIFTIPNIMSMIRLLCIPLFLYLLFGRDNYAGAAWLIGILGATDWIDGYIARRFNQVSSLGKILDPTADRLMFIVALIGMIIAGISPLWFFWLVLIRESVFGGVVAIATLAGMKPFDVTWWGKMATFLLMFALPGLLLGQSDFRFKLPFQIGGWLLGIPGLIISYWTAITYIPVIRKNLRDGRAERAARVAPSVKEQSA